MLVYLDSRGAMLADSITYRALFSVFAGILLGFSVAALWLGGNPDALHMLAHSLSQVIPGIDEFLDVDKLRAPIGFTLTGIVSLVGLVGAAVGAINSFRIALHVLAEEDLDDISPVFQYLRDILVAITIGLLLALASVGTFLASIGLGAVSDSAGAVIGRIASILIIFAFDTAAIAVGFRLLSGLKTPWKTIWKGSAIGGVGLVVLQEFSGLFVKSASANPLLASFGSLIALLLWFNLSAQVILIASSWIIVAVQEGHTDGIPWNTAQTVQEWREMRVEQKLYLNEMKLQQDAR